MNSVIQRELRVAFSRKAQPRWFRITKWIVAVAVTVKLWGTPYLWWWLGGGAVAALVVHFFWRWKTRAWTQPWGGWHDVEAGSEEEAG